MQRQWTFGQRLGVGMAVLLSLTIAIGLVAVYGLRAVVASKDHVIGVTGQNLIDAERLGAAAERKNVRGFLLTRDPRFLDDMREARQEFVSILEHLKKNVDAQSERKLLEAVARREAEHEQAAQRIVAMRRGEVDLSNVVDAFAETVAPKHQQLGASLETFIAEETRIRDDAKRASTEIASSATTLVIVIAIAAALIAVFVTIFLTRALGRQIGGAVGQIQSSSTELQSAASQQATASKEQSTAMNEIATTINELLVTARQIAESAQRVAHIAGQTASAARAGDGTVEKANESITAIRRQVDLVVAHMLELGKKSQQIGLVLDIVSELAEQTNILAINATIEAVGAGESGRRFAVVADEIRKLADRVGGSAKEVRGLIDEVRGAVNTTVMATETGFKAVEAGSKQFGEVASAFKHIASAVATTSDAGREIELSTKQQSTAVEQVNVAIANVAQATRETEASSSQTLQTASLLARLSQDLSRLVRAEGSA